MTTALQVVPDRGVEAAGTMALALMDDAEFQDRLDALKRGKQRIQAVQRGVMTKDVDYGVIPGTNKPTLLKPGAEALCNMYRLVPSYVIERHVGDGVTAPHLTYTVICFLHPGNGDEPHVGSGVGSCNTWEDKYRYRSADIACPQCGESAVRKGARQYGGGWFCDRKKGGCGAKFPDRQFTQAKMDNPDPFSLDNTILKMAKKRAYVDATLETCDASDLFTQDIGDDTTTAEEMPQPSAERSRARTKPAAPQDGPPPPDQPFGQSTDQARLWLATELAGIGVKPRGREGLAAELGVDEVPDSMTLGDILTAIRARRAFGAPEAVEGEVIE